MSPPRPRTRLLVPDSITPKTQFVFNWAGIISLCGMVASAVTLNSDVKAAAKAAEQVRVRLEATPSPASRADIDAVNARLDETNRQFNDLYRLLIQQQRGSR